ncbi:RNA-binding cell elongation regulator Jag/EloR [Candidatus Binatus sp.]|uniref:RNA-binding cell elongation regulator Jag/EloR n=2 Tax=Candidatus Binatus sp. TaxID=2811406 RepID=UPI003BAF1C87
MSNMDWKEVEAASVEEATREALEQLGAREDDVTIEVISTPRAGVLGLGARQARVRVTRKGAEGVGAEPAATPPASQAPRERNEGASDGRGRGRENQRRGRNDGSSRSQSPAASSGGDDDGGAAGRRSADLEEQRREAMVILKQILEQMGEPTEVRQIEIDAETVEIEIKGDGSGILIGRHGQTLDALEYLVNRILARRIKDAAPISLETESYRARRRQQLHRMALSMGEKAKREHKPVRLEPMPPRDRRVVHLALKDDPMITTRSGGDGIMRAIEIVPTDSSGGRREQKGDGQNRGRRREPEREKPREREREVQEVQRIEPERGNEAIGEQGGFKHGQKRIV